MIERYQPDSVMLEGGDPLVVKPSYIRELLHYIDTNTHIRELGLTTNLWDFWKHPEKWIDIFKHPKMIVCTSFQYGSKRKLSDDVVIDEQLFTKIFDKYVKLVGKKINFISVLDYDNEQYVYNTVQFAKKLGVYCRINPAFVSGRCEQGYPFYKAIKHYTNIILDGDGDVVDNCYSLMRVVMHQHNDLSCPYIRNCSNVFRVVSPDNVVLNCSVFGTDANTLNSPNLIWANKTLNEIDVVDNNPHIVCSSCLTCRCFDICNGCRVNISNIQKEDLSIHCNTIKQCYDDITRYIIRTNEL